jgi:hypothetical protein
VDLRAGLDDLEKRKFLTLPRLELRPLGRAARSDIPAPRKLQLGALFQADGGCSLSSGFSNRPRPELSASNSSNSSQLLNRCSSLTHHPTNDPQRALLIRYLHVPRRKHRFSVAMPFLP